MPIPARPPTRPLVDVGPNAVTGDVSTAPVCRGGFQGQCLPEWESTLFDGDGLKLGEWETSGRVCVVKSGPHRVVYRVQLPAGGVYVKRYFVSGWTGRLQHMVRKSRAELEWEASRAVAAAGIPTFEPLAVGVQRRGPFVESSWLVTREIPDAAPLDDVVLRSARYASRMGSLPRRRELAFALGTLVGTLHRAGLVHRDLHAGNILVGTSAERGGPIELALIDLHALSRVGRLSDCAVRRNLALLNNFFAGRATSTDRLAFFEAWSIAREGMDAAPDRDRCRAIDAHCRRAVERAYRDGDAKWRRGNRRLRIVDDARARCRGLAMIGRDALCAWRDGGAPPNVAPAELAKATLVRFDPPRGMSARVRQRMFGGKASRAWEMGHALLRRGIPAVRPIAFVEPRDGSRPAYLITDIPDTAIPLSGWVAGVGASPPPAEPAIGWGLEDSTPATPEATNTPLGFGQRARLARHAASAWRRFHDLGFDHAEPTADHMLVVQDSLREGHVASANFSVVFTGLHRVSRRAMPHRRIVRQLSQFDRSMRSSKATRADRLRFLMRYLGSARHSGWKSWWRSIDAAGLPRAGTSRWAARLLIASIALCGCHLGGPKAVVMRPTKHSVRSEQLLVLSDFKLAKDHAVIKDLIDLRGQVAKSFDLQFDSREVTIYLFSNQLAYRQYLDVSYPGLPDRRAYFVGTPKELAVYTFWGERIQEDLRHEYTHGLLHSTLKAVPLWLDEGLAEYFEVVGPKPGTINGEYVTRLTAALANGWRPDIQRLERIEEFSQMQRFDYQEAWAWVHYLMHGSPDGREVLIGFLHDLRTDPKPEPLSARLKREMPESQTRLAAYVASLPTARAIAEGLDVDRH